MRTNRRNILCTIVTFVVVTTFLDPRAAFAAAWFDPAWPFRRAIDVTWDAEHSDGQDMGTVEFYTAGKADSAGRDVRIATEDGKVLPSDVLMCGPGDRMRIAFAMQKDVKRYYVYWGHTGDAPPPPKLEYHRGLLLDMKLLGGQMPNNAKQMLRAWDDAIDPVGKTIIERPFVGNNVLGDQQRVISKMSGHLYAPMDGNYQFAMAAADRALLVIDGKNICFASGAVSDIRFNGTIDLTRGPHEFVIYHAAQGGDWLISVGWKRPDSAKIEILTRDAFGYAFPGQVGPLEELKKTLVADFTQTPQGEAFFADHYVQHVRFNAVAAKDPRATYAWDFGDGQTASGAQVDHIYLLDGVYPLKLTVRVGGNSDSRTNRLVIGRDFDHLARPLVDDVEDAATIVAAYDLETIGGAELIRAVNLQESAKNTDAMIAAATALASKPKVPDVERAYAAICHVADALADKPGPAAVAALWANVPKGSNLQPRAVRQQARALLWGVGDFAGAVQALRDKGDAGDDTNSLLGVGLVLTGSVDEGAKLLRDLKGSGDQDKHAALAGAMARTIEFELSQKSAEDGDVQWDRWQAMYPVDFLEGYSLLLKTRLIELHGEPRVAAKLAEAFAVSVPNSSYSPQLLDRASKLLAKSDPSHAKELHDLLRKRYPEDPLSQN